LLKKISGIRAGICYDLYGLMEDEGVKAAFALRLPLYPVAPGE
jgi:hypothetical protein